MRERVTFDRPDDAHVIIRVDGKEIAHLSHDEDGWHGMKVATDLAEAVAVALAKPPPGPLRWERLEDPPRRVRRVRFVDTGTIATRVDREGRYWDVPGWADSISWRQVLAWGPVEEVRGRG
jgi:hypothetical protein